MPPKKHTTISPLARIRKESNPPWSPASKKLTEMAHNFSRLWWELWEYHDEARWILESEVEAVCEEIEQLKEVISKEDDYPDPEDRSPQMRRAQDNLVQDYQEAILLQKKLRAWTANCRKYMKKVVKERKALVAQIIREGNSLRSIGLDRWRYWYMGSFDKLGREEIVFHLPLEQFVRCKGSATEYARIRLEDYSEGFEIFDVNAEEAAKHAPYLDQGLVPIVAYVDEIQFDKNREVYHVVLRGDAAAERKKARLAIV